MLNRGFLDEKRNRVLLSGRIALRGRWDILLIISEAFRVVYVGSEVPSVMVVSALGGIEGLDSIPSRPR